MKGTIETDIWEFNPEYTQRDNKGRGKRITLKYITARATVSKPGGRTHTPVSIEIRYRVTDNGDIRLSHVKNNGPNGEKLYGWVLRNAIPVVEQAVIDWIDTMPFERINPPSFSGELDECRGGIGEFPFVIESEVKQGVEQ